MRIATEAQRVELGVEVHERFNSYVGIYLDHLYWEETELQQALWDNFTDEELIAMGAAIRMQNPLRAYWTGDNGVWCLTLG